jgi:hypothetical protein
LIYVSLHIKINTTSTISQRPWLIVTFLSIGAPNSRPKAPLNRKSSVAVARNNKLKSERPSVKRILQSGEVSQVVMAHLDPALL